ncbi:hypothetical protein [Glaciecola petra]|uniref:Phage holin family protein n=1 Tax=Glaciecola petra TaxID=3075602 RepID=A0ABU2ZVF5_9ALTE|nr:hypothetical protein [Aestuariibacter sp. P117]MDT0596628.1 hypothetical protein [Aestuariibacter sp. P117]
MIQLAICVCLVWCLIKLIDKDEVLDGFTAIAFVLVPAFILFGGSLLVSQFGLPIQALLIFELAYFFVPLVMLKIMTQFSWMKIIGFSFAVLVANFVSQIVIRLLLA